MSGLSAHMGASYAARVLALAPVAYYPLNETNGHFAYSATETTGAAGLKKGRLLNTTPSGSTAPNGGASTTFVPASNSVIDIASATLKAAYNAQEITVALWFKARASSVWTDGATRLLFILTPNGTNAIRIRKLNPNTLNVEYQANGTSKSVSYTYSGTGWTHVAITASLANDAVKMYVNGVQVGTTQTGLGTFATTQAGTIVIGANTSAGPNAWDGDIADVVIGSRAYTDAEIATLAGQPGGRASWSNGAAATNAAAALSIPTYDGSNQPTHPDVIDFGSGTSWNGYRYWMVMTPYPLANNVYENPSIVASNDGDTWVEPAGITNPLDPQPSPGFNSDVDLLYNVFGTNELVACYRQTLSAADTYFYRSSTDGITWGAETTILGPVGSDNLGSTSFVKQGSTWYAWSCILTAFPITLWRRSASALTGTWSAATQCTINGLPATKDIWHIDVRYDTATNQYHMLACVRDTVWIANDRSLYFLTSSDGLTWTMDRLIMEPTSNGFDSYFLYRSTLVRTVTGYDVWYGASNIANAWKIGRTSFVL